MTTRKPITKQKATKASEEKKPAKAVKTKKAVASSNEKKTSKSVTKVIENAGQSFIPPGPPTRPDLVTRISKEQALANPEIWGPVTIIDLPAKFSQLESDVLETMKHVLVDLVEAVTGEKVGVDQISFGIRTGPGKRLLRTLVIRPK